MLQAGGIAGQILIVCLAGDHRTVVAAQRKRRQIKGDALLLTFFLQHGPEDAVGRYAACRRHDLAPSLPSGLHSLGNRRLRHGPADRRRQMTGLNFLSLLVGVVNQVEGGGFESRE